MRIRSIAALVAVLSLIIAACGGGQTGASGTARPSGTTAGSVAATTAPTVAASPSEAATASAPAPSATAGDTAEPSGTDASVAPSGSAGTSPGGEALRIGLVTDVGTLDDKNFNQFSYEGAQRGAEAVGGTVQAVVTEAAADYATNIQAFVDQDYDVIVTVGFALGNDTTIAAKANPDINFIGVDQGVCVNAEGAPDPTFACEGDPATLLPNYQGLVFNEAQPGYLAGIVAASISETGVIGAIGGSETIPPVVNYIKGYENGAKSVNPDIKVEIAYVSDDLNKAFNDPAGGKAFAEQFIQQAKPDVLFQVAGKTGNGVLEAACDADINAIGVDVDQHQSTPESAQCIVTSAEKKLSNAVMQAIQRVADGTAEGGTVVNDAANEGIGLSPFYEFEAELPADLQGKLDEALEGMKSGTIDPAATPGA